MPAKPNWKRTFQSGDESRHGEFDGPVRPAAAVVAIVGFDGDGAAEGGADFVLSRIQEHRPCQMVLL